MFFTHGPIKPRRRWQSVRHGYNRGSRPLKSSIPLLPLMPAHPRQCLHLLMAGPARFRSRMACNPAKLPRSLPMAGPVRSRSRMACSPLNLPRFLPASVELARKCSKIHCGYAGPPRSSPLRVQLDRVYCKMHRTNSREVSKSPQRKKFLPPLRGTRSRILKRRLPHPFCHLLVTDCPSLPSLTPCAWDFIRLIFATR